MKIRELTLLLLTAIAFITASCSMPASETALEGDGLSMESSEAHPYGKNVKIGYLGSQKIYYEIIDGMNIFQGDIILDDSQITDEPVRGAGMSDLRRRWPNNTVPYRVDKDFPESRRYIIYDAIKHWEEKTPLRFVERTTETTHLVFYNYPYGSSSSIGMRFGNQRINLLNKLATTSSAIHEIGHAIGLFHEHSRTDRDNYIIINWDNIKEHKKHNFLTFTEDGYEGFNFGHFDFDSLMIYPSIISDPSFVHHAPTPTITKLDGSNYWPQKNFLSKMDVLTVHHMYPSLAKPYYPTENIYQRDLKGDTGCNIIPGDFNGDGKTDFIRQEKNHWDHDELYTFSLYTSNGDGTFKKTVPQGAIYQADLKGDYVNIIPGDFNGDGKTDFIRQRKTATGGGSSDFFSIYFSHGNGQFGKYVPTGTIYENTLRGDAGCNIIPGDFNGDRKTDFIRQEHSGWDDDNRNVFSIYYSLGNGRFRVDDSNSGNSNLKGDLVNIIAGDFNGDRLCDFIAQKKSGNFPINFYYGRKDQTFDSYYSGRDIYQKELRGDYGAILIPGDYNGDGKTDFIRQEKNGWDNDAVNTFSIYYYDNWWNFRKHTPSEPLYQEDMGFDNGCNLIPGDFNGDGKTDFIRQEKGRLDDDLEFNFIVFMME